MIVLDEELQGQDVAEAISRWYRGAVSIITELRPRTVIKDRAIPSLLRSARQPTFITINYTDFWRRIPPSTAYCLVCLRLTTQQIDEVSVLVRRLFSLREFRTKGGRMGKVALVSRSSVQYYEKEAKVTHLILWR
jgi:hypothetical protein